MADQELFDGAPKTTIEDNENIAFRTPGEEGSRVISWVNFKNLLKGAFVALLGDQNIDGIKTFLKSPIVPDPTTDLQAVNLRTLIANIGDTDNGIVTFYNDTGSQINPGAPLHLISAVDVNGVLYPTFEIADASTYEKVQGTIIICNTTVLIDSLGTGVEFSQKITGVDTALVPPGSQLWIPANDSGILTHIKPEFPNYSISVGGNYTQSANGEIFVNITSTPGDIFHEAWDGSVLESFNFTVSSNGVDVVGLLENVDNLRNLTLNYSDGPFMIDTTTTPLTIKLTDGTDESPVTNYVYIPKTTKEITLSTTGWPTTEHCKVAQLEVQSAATIVTELGTERNQNINDHIKKEDDNGHILHIAERVRQLNAEHDNGTEGTLTGTTANGYLQVTGGQVWQMHKQTFASFSMPARNAIISNDFTTPNRRTNNLNTITAYSTGSSWNNEWSKIVVWGISNKTGEPDFIKVNLPSDGYNSEANAISDALNYADYSIPNKYKGVGFLIAAFTFRVSGGTITYNGGSAYQDLRGFIPNNIAGGGGGAGITSLLALSDVFINDYAGKEGEVVKVNDLETGIDTEPKGRIWNAARTFYHDITSLATANFTATLPTKSGTYAFLDDITVSRISAEIAEDQVGDVELDWDGNNDFVSNNILVVTTDIVILYSNTTNAHFADFYLDISSPAEVTFPSGTISPDVNFDTLVWAPPEDGIYGFGIRKVGTDYVLLVTPIPAT